MNSTSSEHQLPNDDMTAPQKERPSTIERPQQSGLTRGAWIGVIVLLLILAVIVVSGIISRSAAKRSLEKQTEIASIPTVNVVYPHSSGVSNDLALPGNTQAFTDTPIYSRTSGYLKRWYFDIGA